MCGIPFTHQLRHPHTLWWCSTTLWPSPRDCIRPSLSPSQPDLTFLWDQSELDPKPCLILAPSSPYSICLTHSNSHKSSTMEWGNENLAQEFSEVPTSDMCLWKAVSISVCPPRVIRQTQALWSTLLYPLEIMSPSWGHQWCIRVHRHTHTWVFIKVQSRHSWY